MEAACGAMEVEAAACATVLPPGILFAPEDEVAVKYYLLPRLLGRPLHVGGLIHDDDPLSAPPWELLERNGCKEQAFFIAKGQPRCGKGPRQKRTCKGGGSWEGQKTIDNLRVPGVGKAAWRKKLFNFHDGGSGDKKRSAGWVMHEYAVTAPEDLARSPLRLYHIRLRSYGRKHSCAMRVPLMPALGLLPGFVFAPEDSDVVLHYLLPRMLGQPLPLRDLILDDDPLSAKPWKLLERNRCWDPDDAFFFAQGQAKSGKDSRQKRTCAGGGFWNGEKTCVDGEKLLVPGPGGGTEVAWRKKALSFQEDGEKGSTGWVMHEYAITAPDYLAESQLMLYRIRFSGHGKKRKRGDEGPAGDEARRRVAEDALQLPMAAPPQPISSSSVLTDHYYSNGADCIAAPVEVSTGINNSSMVQMDHNYVNGAEQHEAPSAVYTGIDPSYNISVSLEVEGINGADYLAAPVAVSTGVNSSMVQMDHYYVNGAEHHHEAPAIDYTGIDPSYDFSESFHVEGINGADHNAAPVAVSTGINSSTGLMDHNLVNGAEHHEEPATDYTGIIDTSFYISEFWSTSLDTGGTTGSTFSGQTMQMEPMDYPPVFFTAPNNQSYEAC